MFSETSNCSAEAKYSETFQRMVAMLLVQILCQSLFGIILFRSSLNDQSKRSSVAFHRSSGSYLYLFSIFQVLFSLFIVMTSSCPKTSHPLHRRRCKLSFISVSFSSILIKHKKISPVVENALPLESLSINFP